MQNPLAITGLALAVLAAAELGGCAQPKPPEPIPVDSPITVTPNPRQDNTDPGVNNLAEALARVDQQKRLAAAEKKLAAEHPGSGGASIPDQNPNDPIQPTHVESPTGMHMKGIPSITDTATPSADTNPPAPDTAPASQPAAAMGAIKIDNDSSAVTPADTQPSTLPAPTTAPAIVATRPAPAPAAEITLDAAMDVLRKHVAEHPTLNTRLALGLLDATEGKPASNLGEGLSEPDQKLLADLLAALQGMAANTGATVADRAAPIVALTKRWETTADLSLPKLALASRVDSFGVFTPVDAKFSQGQKHTVIIYCEVANFAAKPIDGGWYETHLTQQETLITEDKLLVWRPNPEDVVDRSMNQRHDFYLVKKLTIPDNLAVGKYSLQMSVTDANSGKAAIKSIALEITDK